MRDPYRKMIDINPNLRFHCNDCGETGPRELSKETHRRQVPSFTDYCPGCGGEDVSVYDARF